MRTPKIPNVTVARLPIYLRYLMEVDRKGMSIVSSYDIAKSVGANPASVRRDLAHFGEFGIKGSGYYVKDLRREIMHILGFHTKWTVTLVGFGHLGQALSSYKGFQERGFIVDSIFDNDSSKVGSSVNGLQVLPVNLIEEVLRKRPAQIGIICVPSSVAQEIADTLVRSNIKAILNFAPVVLKIPSDISLQNVDLVANLDLLTFNLGVQHLTESWITLY